jgi:serine/threonine protein kinase
LACPEAYANASLGRRDIIGPMSLLPGTRLGPYEVHSALGAGGMGEVYRARDTKLGRDVALKIIPESWASDPDRLARFQREAQMLASLNHPHIAAIYGFEESPHPSALVLELVEGPTLAARIEQGPILVEDALPIARQIADALEGAHERGIVHRDLKPANIKLRPDGTVKVLDFGLAKAVEPAAGTATAHSPTITSPAMTQLGTILGTAAYMSPEQAKGRAADKRSDIWAFGCVLFEMLAGVQVFAGDDVTDSIAAILRAEPDWQKLPADTPPAIRRLLRRCLEKDPKERLTDIGVARLEIKDALATPFSEAPSLARPASRRVLLPWIVAATSLAASLALVAWSLRRDPVDLFPLRLEIVPPAGFWSNSVALSPDGKQLAFVAPVNGTPSLWLRRLDQETAQPVSGTKDAYFPFWSPDGRAIGFFAGSKLQRINLSGGPPQELADVTVGRGASWSRDDVILFAPSLDSGLMRVTATGGVPVARSVTMGGPWTLPQPWTPRTRPPLLGKRRERVSHSAHRRHFREKRSDHLSNGSGQITCQQQEPRIGYFGLPRVGTSASAMTGIARVRPSLRNSVIVSPSQSKSRTMTSGLKATASATALSARASLASRPARWR